MRKFFLVFIIVFVVQLPGCTVVVLNDAGQIDYNEYTRLIRFSEAVFMFPIKLLNIPLKSMEVLLFLYLANIALIAFVVWFLLQYFKNRSFNR